MPTRIYIFGEGSFLSSRRPGRGVWDLERDLNDLLQDKGEVIRDGEWKQGACWNIDLLLDDGADVETWIGRLVVFLQGWGVVDRTLTFTIVREGEGSRWEHRRIEIADK